MRDFENNPYGDDEQFPTFRISVRTAARLIGDGLAEWNGEEIPDSDSAPFRRPDPVSESVSIGAHEYANIEPIGKMKTACLGIEAALVNAIDQGHIAPRQTRRSIAGEVKPAQTYLNVDDVIDWCETVGIDPGEQFFEYREHEESIAASAYEYLENERFKLENEATLKDVGRSTVRLSEEEIAKILIENLRFREGHFGTLHQVQVRGIANKERNQLLKMVLGMALDSYGYQPKAKKNEATGQIVGDLAKYGIGIDADTVRKYLKEAAETVSYQMPKLES